MKLSMPSRISALLLALALTGQSATYTTGGTSHQYYQGIASTSTTAVINGTVYVETIMIINASASAVQVSVTDRSTDCAGGPCSFTAGTSAGAIPSGQTWSIPCGDMVAPNGIAVSATDGTNITVKIHYRTTMNI